MKPRVWQNVLREFNLSGDSYSLRNLPDIPE